MKHVEPYDATTRAVKSRSTEKAMAYQQSLENDILEDEALTSQALNPDGSPRRPMNAFMIFARRRRPQLAAENTALRTGECDKQFYLDQAKILKDNFNAKYPDYVYRRRPNNSRRRKKEEGHTVGESSTPTPSESEGSEPSPVDGSESTSNPHSSTSTEQSSPPAKHRLPYPQPSLSQRPGSEFLPPLWNGSGVPRTFSAPSWSPPPGADSAGPRASFSFPAHHSPFYPTSVTTPGVQPPAQVNPHPYIRRSSYPNATTSSNSSLQRQLRLFEAVDTSSRHSDHSPFDYLLDLPGHSSNFQLTDPFGGGGSSQHHHTLLLPPPHVDTSLVPQSTFPTRSVLPPLQTMDRIF
ncbi:hypothetical protein DL96DRAFT_1555298 [Flagelloscypha sp. PMI_526]|nr:hypothetical protein DL96DRAFT_1555298 [Flagelloscypha sp. PMI_526]